MHVSSAFSGSSARSVVLEYARFNLILTAPVTVKDTQICLCESEPQSLDHALGSSATSIMQSDLPGKY